MNQNEIEENVRKYPHLTTMQSIAPWERKIKQLEKEIFSLQCDNQRLKNSCNNDFAQRLDYFNNPFDS
jgi:hypothetical protein